MNPRPVVRKAVWTFRSRVLLLVVVTVVLTAMAIQYLSLRETRKAMFTAHDENALNLMNTVALNVESEYRSILFHREAMRERRKTELRNIVDLAFKRVEERHKAYREGRFSEAEAQRRALADLRSLRYDDGVGYLWVNDTGVPTPRMVMHPIMPELEGTFMLEGPRFNSVLGAQKNLLAAFVDICRETGEGYVEYLWPKPAPEGLDEDVPKISYVKRFEPWGWILGTGVYVDDIEEETQKRVDAVQADLKQTLAKARIAETGYLFIFSGDKQVLVHPYMTAGDDTRNPSTGRDIRDEFMVAARTPRVPFEYLWDKPGHRNDRRFLKRAYITHFKPLDWYIAASFFVEEMERPARRLAVRVFLVSCVVLLVAVGFAVIVSKSLTEPLKRLALAAARIEREGIRSAEIPISGTAETVELGTILRNMLASIERSERDLKKANSYIGSILDSMPSVLIGVDADGKVTHWNRAAEQAIGLLAGEALQRPVDEVLPNMASEMERMRTAIQSRQTLTAHRRTHLEDQEVRFHDVTVYPLIADGIQGAVIRLDDVTERVRMEELMVQSEKMLSVGGLAAGMAHEINNPLAGMMQTASVLSSRLTDDLPANTEAARAAGTSMEAIRVFMQAREIPRMLHRIRQSGIQAAEIVSNMLNFARKSDRAFSTHNLVELLDQTLALAGSDYDLKKEYDFRQIEIVRQYEESVPEVPCEASRIQQVLLNVLRNGAEAMHEEFKSSGGSKKPRFTLRLAHEREAGWVRIEVEDNGPGMDEATQKRVFEPFFTTKPTDRGTGLGLSVSYFIVTENHGGQMTVESAPGAGTRFIIRLPMGRDNGRT